MKVASIVVIKSQFLKMSVFYRESRKVDNGVLIRIGQPYDYKINKIFYNELNITEPDHFLEIVSDSHENVCEKTVSVIDDLHNKEVKS